ASQKRMCSALASTVVKGDEGRSTHSTGWKLCPELLPGKAWASESDPERAAFCGFSSGIFSLATPFSPQQFVAGKKPMVCYRCAPLSFDKNCRNPPFLSVL